MVTRQQFPLGDFKIIPDAISVMFTSPPVTVNFDLGLLFPTPILPLDKILNLSKLAATPVPILKPFSIN